MIKGGPYVLILCALGAALLAAAIGGAWERFPPADYGPSLEPVRPGQETSIKRATFADGRLWLLSDAGELWTVREAAAGAERASLPDPALDICAQDGSVVVVTTPRRRGAAWTIWQGAAGSTRWAARAQIASQDEGLVALACDSDGLVLLTSRRLVELRGSQQRSVLLSNRQPASAISTMLATPTQLYLGLNAGEWGGGLERIDRRTGDVRLLERSSTAESCGGPLNADCDPVNGIAPSPWKPGCVVAAVGLVHMVPHGRLVEVCSTEIRSLYEVTCPSLQSAACTEPMLARGRFASEPFFGVVARGRTLLAVSGRDIVALDADGASRRSPGPAFERRGPFQVSFNPGFVLVKTAANERRSLSGSTPLIVLR